MITKRRLALLSSLSAAPAFAAPFLAIGDNAELFLTASSEARYEDNVSLSSTGEVSDEIFTFTPGAELVFGKNSLTKGSLSVYENFIAYSDLNNLNSQNDNALFQASYDGAKLSLKTDASYREMSQNTRDTNGAASSDRKVYTFGADGEYAVTEKSKIGSGFSYSSTVYDNAGYADQDVYTVPVNYFFAIRPKIDLSAGIQYRDTEVSELPSATASSDSEDYYFNVGARGEFTPKLSGKFNTGYTVRQRDGASDESTWTLNAGLSYAYTEKTAFTLDLGRDFETGADSSNIETSSINIGASTQFNAAWSANIGIGYQKLDYTDLTPDRSDDYVTATLGVNYIYNEHLNFAAGYSYADNETNDSTYAASSFTANTFRLSANFRY